MFIWTISAFHSLWLRCMLRTLFVFEARLRARGEDLKQSQTDAVHRIHGGVGTTATAAAYCPAGYSVGSVEYCSKREGSCRETCSNRKSEFFCFRPFRTTTARVTGWPRRKNTSDRRIGRGRKMRKRKKENSLWSKENQRGLKTFKEAENEEKERKEERGREKREWIEQKN